ncbi:MAG: hypothetical protein KKF48_05050 [Nanoarchaeota archaeon]|nr:hypothetical protein [Nanoarchaeota archaeon]MBU1028385.1 hypothetical protein [Nanoarchaeota archaeon]
MDLDTKIKKLAAYEINWWKAHHRRDESKLIVATAKFYELQSTLNCIDINYSIALEIGKLRWAAVKCYSKAKEFDGKDQSQAKIYWGKAQENVEQMFRLLYEDKK